MLSGLSFVGSCTVSTQCMPYDVRFSPNPTALSTYDSTGVECPPVAGVLLDAVGRVVDSVVTCSLLGELGLPHALTNISAAEQIVTYSYDHLRLLLAYLLLFSGLENSNKYAAGMGYSARRERRPSSSVHSTVGSLSPNFSNHSLMSGSSASHSS
jgi:hypothetical protein